MIDEIVQEHLALTAQWGDDPLPLGFGWHTDRVQVVEHRHGRDEAVRLSRLTHRHILLVRMFEALAEKDPAKARDELLQVAAACVKTVQDIDRAAAGG